MDDSKEVTRAAYSRSLERCPHRGFTLMELILVMTVLTIAASITAPALANFFRGRSLDSEARRMLGLIRQGQSRAVSEGVPMELWIDSQQGEYGLEAEPSYELNDPKLVTFTLEHEMHLEAGNTTVATALTTPGSSANPRLAASSKRSSHPNLPTIRFLPDGTVGETSPQSVRLSGLDGRFIFLSLSRNGLNYEIRTR